VSDEPTNPLDETIEEIIELERAAAAAVSSHQRRLESVLLNVGRPRTFYAVVGFVVVWIGANLALTAGGQRPFDPPPFSGLQGLVSISALLMTVLVLTAANRLSQLGAQRDQLDLQMNLLNERRTGKLIRMLDALRRDDPQVPTHHDPEVAQLSEPAHAQEVIRAFEERADQSSGP